MITQKAGNKTSFGALCVAKYHVPNGKKTAEVAIYQLEPKDVPMMTKIYGLAKKDKLIPQNATKPGTARYNMSAILEESIQKALDTINMAANYAIEKEPSARYIAVCKNQFCGVIMGNMPKINRTLKKICYSWTEKPHETELNFIATSPLRRYSEVKGIGTVITAELFNFMQRIRGAKIMRVKSATFAEDFYKKVGFVRERPKNCIIPCETTDTPREIAPMSNAQKYAPEDSEVVSMKITRNKAAKKFAELASKFQREEGEGESIDLASVLRL